MNALSLLSLQFLSLSLSFGVLQLVVTTFVTKIIYFNLINIFFLTIKSKVCFSSCSYCWCLSLKCRMMYVQRLTLEGCFALILQGCKGLVQRWVWSEQGPWGRGLPPPPPYAYFTSLAPICGPAETYFCGNYSRSGFQYFRQGVRPFVWR